jgi:hypothetical protein
LKELGHEVDFISDKFEIPEETVKEILKTLTRIAS